MIGQQIRELRESNNLLLRHLAAKLDIDTAMLSKMERGERSFKREEIIEIANILSENKEALINLWLADKVLQIIKNETQAKQILEIVKTNLK